MMPELIPVLDKDTIQKIVADVARRISIDYQDRELILLGVLKGSFIFLSDLMRQLSIQAKVDFIGASSYGSGTSSSEKIIITKDITIDIRNKDVLIVEDIIDTGLTLAFIIEHLKSFGPNSVKICAFLDKKERRKQMVSIDYAGYGVETGFLVGYGLDFNEQYRNLPDIYHLKI
jgi:hypoxanthine phosphoribosyltransferase